MKMSGQSPSDGLVYPHFAMIYIDREGNLCQRVSKSIAESRQKILSPRVMGEFLRAVARSRESQGAQHQVPISIPSNQEPEFKEYSPASSQREIMAHGEVGLDSEHNAMMSIERDAHLQSATWSHSNHTWPLQQKQAPNPRPRKKHFGGRSLNLTSHQSASISVKDPDVLRLYYEKIFQNLQQTNCRVIAKAYIKLVEPRKQVNYPYNGRKTVEGRVQQLDPEATKPPWWPTGVCHREPDHLPKAERIRLLVHILCELRESNGITAAKLKECDQPIRRQILPIDRLQILDEVYRVREEEERFLDGISDGETSVLISRTNMPQIEDDSSSEQSSPTAPGSQVARSECSDEIPRSETGQAIMSTEDPQQVSPYYQPNMYNPLSNPTIHTSPMTQHPNPETSPHTSRSPQELKRKRDQPSGSQLVDRTRPVDMIHFPYQSSSVQQPTELLYHPHSVPEAGVITGPSLEGLPVEQMMPYGYPYYYPY